MNFLHFQDLNLNIAQAEVEVYKILFFFQVKPQILALVSLGVLLGTVLSLFLTNWSKIMLVLGAEDFLDRRPFVFKKKFSESLKVLWPVIKVSLLTSALMLSAALVLLVPPVFFVESLKYQSLLWVLGAMIFLPMAFTISAFNIFGAFFIIEFKLTAGKALDLATDFFATSWTKILSLAVILMLIYAGVFAGGVLTIFLVKLALNLIFAWLAGLGISTFSGMIVLARIISGVLLWVLVAGLNVFFNTALLLLFKELVKPKKDSFAAKSPAPATV